MFSPGSIESFQSGCRCPVAGNCDGAGLPSVYTNCHEFVISDDCPLHGPSCWAAMAEGIKRLGLWWDELKCNWEPKYFTEEDV